MINSKLEFAKHLHQKAVDVAARFKKCEIELIEIVEQVDRHKTYYLLNHPSLFDYVVKGLGLSEAVAYIYIRVARKTREVPALKGEIKSGRIAVSKATKIASVMNVENQDHWLELARSCSKRELERQVALAAPKVAIQEKAEYKTFDNSVRIHLQLGVSENLMLQLRRAQDVLSQKRRRAVSLEEVLEGAVPAFLKKEDPVEIAKRQEVRGKLLVPGRVTPASSERTRKPIPAGLRHKVTLKFAGRCGYVDTHGNRCASTRFTDVHHIKKVASGGTNDFNNLILLCAGHHKMVHAQDPP